MIKILEKYIFKELILPFFFGIFIFTTLLVSSGVLFTVVKYIIEYNISITIATKLFLFKLPQLLAYTLPMSTLLASLLSFSRLSQDNEIIAMKTSGISFYSIIAPTLAFAFLVFIFSFLFNEILVPTTNYKYNKLVSQKIKEESLPSIRGRVFIETYFENPNHVIYFREFDEKRVLMKDVCSIEFLDGKPIQTVNAKYAKWQKTGWFFKEGVLIRFNEKGEPKHFMRFNSQKMNLQKTPKEIITGQKELEEMSLRDLNLQIKATKLSNIPLKDLRLNEILVEMHQRFAIPVASLIFVLIGAPLSIRKVRSSSSMGIVISILIIFIYYVVMTITTTWGKSGVLNPVLAPWVANILFGILGISFVIKTSSV